MNVALWVLQVLLALHTATGAFWKLSSPETSVPSLAAIPHAAWLGLSVLEVFCAAALVAPALSPRAAKLAPIAAIAIACEMLLFCAVHLASGVGEPGELVYWLVVAALCGLVAWGRLRPAGATATA